MKYNPDVVAPAHRPGTPIVPLTHPQAIFNVHRVDHAIIGAYTIDVTAYACHTQVIGAPEDTFHVLRLMHDDVLVAEHPERHQTATTLQASTNLLKGTSFFFTEQWETRGGPEGCLLWPYDQHLSMVNLQTHAITTHMHLLDDETSYRGIDVDSSGDYLLIVMSESGTLMIDVYDVNLPGYHHLDCCELWGYRLRGFRWGASRHTIRCLNEFDRREYACVVDWETHVVHASLP